MSKTEFVHNQLFELIKAIDPNIYETVYRINGTAEFVDVVYKSGIKLHIVVTCDSLAQVAEDVIRAVK